uniref:Uncharacterized protein n=1 Tax=Anguilla anguilla TaxID=7936 RepID=A0A0E9QXU6_ANGAN
MCKQSFDVCLNLSNVRKSDLTQRATLINCKETFQFLPVLLLSLFSMHGKK